MAIRPRTLLARDLRRNATDAERLLWRALREAAWPWRFRRQHPICGYVADFACPARRPVVELDGGQHAAMLDEDEQRTGALAEHGYRVVRFWNNEVLGNLPGVLAVIQCDLETPPPHPDPLRPLGRRGR
ncbi:MAG: endonuclease domain-containing protein [Rhodospirillaceae bacterium]